jgi:GTPase SAR1 family protein
MNKIDIVITWVNGNNKQWLKQYKEYSNKDFDAKRFHNIDTPIFVCFNKYDEYKRIISNYLDKILYEKFGFEI